MEYMSYPGGKVPFTAALSLAPERPAPLPCYRTMDETGDPVEGAEVPHPLGEELAVAMYRCMVLVQTMDTVFYEAQRQGRFPFYMTSTGEEASCIGTSAALQPEDAIFAQYREQGALLWRGMTVQDMAHQCYGNEMDPGKGRQMPIHYCSRDLNIHPISSCLATQLPHAVGAAYAMKLNGSKAVAATYFGDGAASEGDFHAALNFAATLECPALFICRNNGWAISTPANEQYRSDGIAGRGPPGYGMSSVRVDGGDIQAVYNAALEARRYAAERCRPVLLECMSYRLGHHSTSDDSSRYRTSEEMNRWRARDPVSRLQRWLSIQGWWNPQKEAEARKSARSEVVAALERAEHAPKPCLTSLFTDVYDKLPPALQEQQKEVFDTVARHPHLLPHGVKLA